MPSNAPSITLLSAPSTGFEVAKIPQETQPLIHILITQQSSYNSSSSYHLTSDTVEVETLDKNMELSSKMSLENITEQGRDSPSISAKHSLEPDLVYEVMHKKTINFGLVVSECFEEHMFNGTLPDVKGKSCNILSIGEKYVFEC